jgi:hypothetical protein
MEKNSIVIVSFPHHLSLSKVVIGMVKYLCDFAVSDEITVRKLSI